MMKVLEALHLDKTFADIHAVSDVTFSVPQGQVLGLLGVNGAGKTTILSILAGLLRPDAGQVLIAGSLLKKSCPGQRFNIGWVPQDLAVYRELTARENLFFFAGLYGLNGRVLHDRVAEVLEICSLSKQADRLAGTFSGGMLRKLNLAVGLVHDPKILLLDEPTVGLDPQARHEVLQYIRRIAAAGATVIYASQYIHEAQQICDQIAVLHQGRLIAYDTLDEFVRSSESRVELVVTGGRSEWIHKLREMARVQAPEKEQLAARGSPWEEDCELDGTIQVRALEGKDGFQIRLFRPPHGDVSDFVRRLTQLLNLLRDCRVSIEKIGMENAQLEEVFVELTVNGDVDR